MTALCIALAALLALSMSSNVALFVALRGEAKEGKTARDLIEQKEDLADEYRAARDTLASKLKVTEDLLEQEQTLRLIASTQRNEAQRRVGELLRKHVTKATNEEIQELTNEAFQSPISLVPRPPGADVSVPKLPDPKDPRDRLLDPFDSEVQPPKPA
jgi:hypothetical protein